MTDKQLAAIEPCPMCGGEPNRFDESLDERYGYALRIHLSCKSCGLKLIRTGDASKGGYADNSKVESNVIAAWNRRAAPAAPAGGARDAARTDGDKRLVELLTQAFGTRHPAIDDLASLILRANANARDASAQQDEREVPATLAEQAITQLQRERAVRPASLNMPLDAALRAPQAAAAPDAWCLRNKLGHVIAWYANWDAALSDQANYWPASTLHALYDVPVPQAPAAQQVQADAAAHPDPLLAECVEALREISEQADESYVLGSSNHRRVTLGRIYEHANAILAKVQAAKEQAS